ncbi:potassium-transporting ATPase subunit F [Thermus sp. FJN-A]
MAMEALAFVLGLALVAYLLAVLFFPEELS